MKAFTLIAKILAAAAAVVGAVYVAATYGDKIVAWAKKMLPECKCCKGECTCAEEAEVVEEAAPEEVCEAPAEEAAPEEAAEVCEAPVEEAEPVAEEGDFEG